MTLKDLLLKEEQNSFIVPAFLGESNIGRKLQLMQKVLKKLTFGHLNKVTGCKEQ